MKRRRHLAFRIDLAGRAVGRPVRVRVDAEEATDAVGALFPDYRIDPGSGAPDLVLAVLDDRGYSVRGRQEHLGTPTLPEAVSLLEQLLTRELARSLEGVRVIHGAAVATPTGTLLIPGPGGAGKSTLATGLAGRGCPLLGDDVVLLSLDDRLIHPFKRLLRIDDRAAAIFRLTPPPGALRVLFPGRSFFHPRDLGSTWARPSRLAAVVLPRRRDDHRGRPALTDVSGGAAVKEILEQVLLVERVGPEEFRATADALAGARLSELRFDRSDRAVELLASELLH